MQPSLGVLTPHASRDEMRHFLVASISGSAFKATLMGRETATGMRQPAVLRAMLAGVSSVAACSGMKVIESSSPLGNLPSGFLIPFRWLERVDCHLSLSHAER